MPEFEKATSSLSTTEEAKKSAVAVLDGIASLEVSAKQGAADDAKLHFVEAVSALQVWATDAGIADSIKGL
jgi:hypothetical protein